MIFSKWSNPSTLVNMFKCQYQTTLLLTNVVEANTKQEQQIQCNTNLKAIIGQCQVRKNKWNVSYCIRTMNNILITFLAQYFQEKKWFTNWNFPFQSKGLRFDPFLKNICPSMNNMDEKKKSIGNFFKLNALRKVPFLREETKW